MMDTKVVHIGHHNTSLAYGSPFNFNFFWWAEIFLVHLCLQFFRFLLQCPLWNTLSGNICSELQSNYTITKSFIIRSLKWNVEKKLIFLYPIVSISFQPTLWLIEEIWQDKVKDCLECLNLVLTSSWRRKGFLEQFLVWENKIKKT